MSPFLAIAIENEARAKAGHAIAAIWHWRPSGFECQASHGVRDDKYFVIRGSWALEKDLIDFGRCKFTDEITRPGEEEGCRCSYQYVYALRDLPHVMLSAKGNAELDRVRRLRAAAGI